MGVSSSSSTITTMSNFAVISAIVLSFSALSWAQISTPYEGHCRVFSSIPSGEIEVYHMKSSHVDGCGTENSTAACIDNCRAEWTGLYKKGDLDAELSNGYNLGQELCLGAVELFHPYIFSEDGAVLSRNCDGNWEDTGMMTKQQLCCDNGHYHEC